MSRLVFGGDLAYNSASPGAAILNAASKAIYVWRDEAASVPETDMQTYPDGVAVTTGQLNVTAYSEIPMFYGPNSGADTLYVVIDGGPITAIYARDNDRIEALSAGVTANTTAIASEAQTARTNEAAAIVTAETFAIGVVGSEASRALGVEATKADATTVSPTKGSNAWLKLYAANPDTLIVGVITRDANGAATSAPVVWPDGTAGTYTADTVSTSFLGAVDAYHVTYGSPATKTVTQSAVTRDATTGAVTNRPALTVA